MKFLREPLLRAGGIMLLLGLFLLLLAPNAVRTTQASLSTQNAVVVSSEGGCADGTPVTIGNDTIYFVQNREDYPTMGQSTWYYCVESGSAPAISHVTYDLNLTGEGGCQTVIEAGTWGPTQDDLTADAGQPSSGNDPTTAIYGLKFDEGFSDGESRNYYFTINGTYEAADITIASQDGNDFDSGNVLGPAIDCNEGDDGADEDISNLCFAIADGYIDEGGTQHKDTRGNDTLAFLDRVNGDTASVDGVIPNMETFKIEGMAFTPGADTLYAANQDRLGIVDLSNGDFSQLSEKFGRGIGYKGNSTNQQQDSFNDIDSLSFDVITGDLWGVDRNSSSNNPDLLIKIDPTTGAHIPGSFPDRENPGQFVDYVEVEPIGNLADIDDLAIDPVTGVMYAIMNQGGGQSRLVVINRETGGTTPVGFYTRQDNGEVIADMEGLAFFNDGQLYGSTGKEFHNRNILWRINKDTAVATYFGEFTNRLVDIEALDCLTAKAFIALEKSTNGQDADFGPGPYIEQGGVVTWTYFVRNTGGVTLSNITLEDDIEGTITCPKDTLVSGEAMTCVHTGTALTGQYENEATVRGEDDEGNPYTDDDPSHYYGYIPAAVGNYVWRDTNANGLQDDFEVGAVGVEVRLYNADDDSLVDTTTTDSTGHYLFIEVDPGGYYIEFVLPAGYTSFTTANADSNDAVDSDAEIATAEGFRTADFNLELGEIDLTWDAGLIGQPADASLGDFVWEDWNANGIQDAGEPGIAGVMVKLFDLNDNELRSDTTGGDGSYQFTGLTPGDYYLVFEQPDGYLPSPANEGSDNAFDSDADPVSGQTGLIELGPGENDDSWDAGFFSSLPIVIGNFVWEDSDEDGIQDEGEPGIEGAVVYLYDGDGNIVASTATDAQGFYEFRKRDDESNLLPGDYYLVFEQPLGYDPSPANQGDDNETDSDADSVTGQTESFTLYAGQTDLTWDAGFYPEACMASIGDTIWLDSDGDGFQSDDEPGIAGVVVMLVGAGDDGQLNTDDDETFTPQTTNDAGFYQFTGLLEGLYLVNVDENSLPEGYALTSGNQAMLEVILTCENNEDADFGYAPSICERSLVYGVFDAGTSDTQFFTLDLGTEAAEALGPVYQDHDIEAIESHPISGTLYAIAGSGAGNGSSNNANVYKVNKEDGELTLVGNAGNEGGNEIVSAAFDPTGTLWAFRENVGLLTIDLNDGSSSNVLNGPTSGNWEGLAWDPDGDYLYATQGQNFYRWDPGDGIVDQLCGDNFLPYETEALDFRFDGKLMGGSHNSDEEALSIFEIDVDTCQVLPTNYDIAYNDVESLTSEECVEGGVVDGTITDDEGRAIGTGTSVAGLELKLEVDINDINNDKSYSFSTFTTTDEDGYFSFVNLPDGRYRLTLMNSHNAPVEFDLTDDEPFNTEAISYEGAEYLLYLPTAQR